ncbi:MAG: hypothetical protein QXN26_05845 [Thermoplasmataceae archaeon]
MTTQEDESRDFVFEIRVRVPKGLVDLAQKTLKDALDVAGDVAKIGRQAVTGKSGESEKPKVKKMEIK